MTTETVWLTPAALQRLRDELASLNPHTAAPAELARIAELRALIARAEATTKPDDGLVEPGMRVTVRFEDDASITEFVIGSRTLLGNDESLDVAVYSPESPLGAAINGLYVGDVATIDAPKGTRNLTIIAATPVA
ncbi:GreA/GreB family elongation factor [Demequina sp.]|uniref:GreA/GreB family elongation factor n=1 Tax=Demequina sp. TaxID=2050685 RepID=UPI003D0A56DF